jgi:hypothetical protein
MLGVCAPATVDCVRDEDMFSITLDARDRESTRIVDGVTDGVISLD